MANIGASLKTGGDLVGLLRDGIEGLFRRDEDLHRLLPLGDNLERAKFSRAKLLMKIAEMNAVDSHLAMQAAMGVEIVHLATLAHDDVIDAADLRRSKASWRSLKGDKVAVLLGDYLFALAVEHVQRTQSRECSLRFMEHVRHTCRGEAVQDLLITSPSQKTDLDLLAGVARGKTGALFSFCMEAPLWMDREYSMEQRRILATIGSNCGLGYQLADDILDIAGSPDNLGKAAEGNDLVKGCMTTPLWLLMRDKQLDWAGLSRRYADDEEGLQRDFFESGCMAKAQEMVEELNGQTLALVESAETSGVRIREPVELFWGRYVSDRIQKLEDAVG